MNPALHASHWDLPSASCACEKIFGEPKASGAYRPSRDPNTSQPTRGAMDDCNLGFFLPLQQRPFVSGLPPPVSLAYCLSPLNLGFSPAQVAVTWYLSAVPCAVLGSSMVQEPWLAAAYCVLSSRGRHPKRQVRTLRTSNMAPAPIRPQCRPNFNFPRAPPWASLLGFPARRA